LKGVLYAALQDAAKDIDKAQRSIYLGVVLKMRIGMGRGFMVSTDTLDYTHLKKHIDLWI
jgi:hypothetical protein